MLCENQIYWNEKFHKEKWMPRMRCESQIKHIL
nr:MAG TPA: hypothetical protein [Caudoviricetes sp.]